MMKIVATYVIPSSQPPERRPLERRMLVPILPYLKWGQPLYNQLWQF